MAERESLISLDSEYERLAATPDMTIEEAKAQSSASGHGCTTDGSPFFPGTQCFVCNRFVGRDGHFSVDYFEMSSTVASVEAWHRECL